MPPPDTAKPATAETVNRLPTDRLRGAIGSEFSSSVAATQLLDVVLDVPLPPSVNRTRKVHWAGHRKYLAWKKQAGLELVSSGQYRKAPRNLQRYELTITLDEERCALDPDNPVKCASDLLKSLEIIVDDGPKFARRIVVEWGHAPLGCRLTLRSVER